MRLLLDESLPRFRGNAAASVNQAQAPGSNPRHPADKCPYSFPPSHTSARTRSAWP